MDIKGLAEKVRLKSKATPKILDRNGAAYGGSGWIILNRL